MKEKQVLIDFSIIIPSRNRLSYFKDLLVSIKEKTFDLSKIEVIIAIDFDDPVLSEYVTLIKSFDTLNCFIIIRERSIFLSADYQNVMARLSKGRFIWGLNDDCVVETQDWDSKFLEAVKEHKSKIFYAAMGGAGHKIMYRDGNFSSGFPMLSREAFEAVGYFMHPEIRGYRADARLHSVFKMVGATIYLPTIGANHKKGKGVGDEVWQTMMKRGGDRGVDYANCVEKLQKALEKEKADN